MKYIILVLMPFVFSASLGAQDSLQSVIASAGGHVETDEIQISWTLGELAVETLATENLTLSQGFHQGKLFVTGLVDDQNMKFYLKTYPNPVKDILFIESDEPGFNFQLIDTEGRVIRNGKVNSSREEMDFSSLEPGTYFLQVGRRTTHKIIKQ